jgi:glycolate oxidase FAD binding subunit
MTQITIKTLPRAETEATLLVLGLDDAKAATAMAAAMGSSCEVSGAAHLPAGITVRASDDLPIAHAVTALRLEGVEPSVAHRRGALETLMKPFGTLTTLGETQSRALWRAIRDVAPFAADGPVGAHPVWRLSTAPTNGPELGRQIARQADAEILYDWAGGLVWVALTPSDDAGARIVHAALAACGGHATLVRAAAAVRASATAFEPQPEAVAALTKRVKDGFDPHGVLNPGRMWAGV